MLIILHLHDDHVNGLKYLWGGVDVGTVVMPYTDEYRNALACMESGRQDKFLQVFYENPVAWFLSKGIHRIFVFPHLYGGVVISEDQVYDGCSFIGVSYKKYIELFNNCYGWYYKRNVDSVFFDCTNYYFEIDLPAKDRQKDSSKENRHDSIIG